jgi:hypothetical protein
MPRNKDLKRLIRSRMDKTGEAYTAARAQLLRRAKPVSPHTAAGSPDYATLAGKSDATVKAKTGCTWARWVGSARLGRRYHRRRRLHLEERYQERGGIVTHEAAGRPERRPTQAIFGRTD